jgi:hypothetical protein
MGTDLVVVIPSRGRPESVERMAVAFAETGADELAVVWALDVDDPDGQAYRDRVGEWFAFGEVLAVGAGSMTTAINNASRYVVDEYDPVAIAVLNDDHLPETMGWHDGLVEALHDLDPVGLVYPDDGLRGEMLATVWGVHSAWVRALGRMVPAKVGHLYTDDAMQNLATALGRITYLPNLMVRHHHPLAGLADTDAGYQRVNSRERHNADRIAFKVWAQSGKRQAQLAALRAVGGSA